MYQLVLRPAPPEDHCTRKLQKMFLHCANRAPQQSYATGMQAPPAGKPPEKHTCSTRGMHEKISLHCQCKAVHFPCISAPLCRHRQFIRAPPLLLSTPLSPVLSALHLHRLSLRNTLLRERLAAASESAVGRRRSAAPFDFPSGELPLQSRPL